MLEQEVVDNLLRPLVQSGVYKDEKSALRDIILDYIDRKKRGYDEVILSFREKYKKDFAAFTNEIKNSAGFETEDDWMEWKGAIEMRKGWQEAYWDSIHGSAV
ncbi:MAG: hypothetical protein KAW12_04180 [Candidatus Aminicenantes bacterium]|nr:hypothetical protein [Candidatus Aminicenantes bacterium]